VVVLVEHLRIEIEREEDGRSIGEIPDLAGVPAYGASRDEAIARTEGLALRVIADRPDHGESMAPWWGSRGSTHPICSFC
jgi:predicted RNase H-like HicB family nuclease